MYFSGGEYNPELIQIKFDKEGKMMVDHEELVKRIQQIRGPGNKGKGNGKGQKGKKGGQDGGSKHLKGEDK